MGISIVVVIGAILAIVILVILINLALRAVERARGAALDPFWVYAIWALVTILCIFIIAYALNIPIPFFHWQ